MIELKLTNYQAISPRHLWAIEVAGHRTELSIGASEAMAVILSTIYGTAPFSLWIGIYESGNPVPKWALTRTISKAFHKYEMNVAEGFCYDRGAVAAIEGFWYWAPGMSSWAVLDPAHPPTLPPGIGMAACVAWRSHAWTWPVSGIATLDMITPRGDSTSKTAMENQGAIAWPEQAAVVRFDAHSLDTEGTWKAKGNLYMDEVRL